MAGSIISIEQLRVIYNQGKSNEVRSLDGVDVEIFPQEYVIIHGPSGCGKSTLLYSIAGLQMPTYGEVSVVGKKMTKMAPADMVDLHQTGVGMIFQAFYLIPSLNVIDNVCLPKAFRGEELEKRREEGMRLLHRFGISEQAYKFPSQLSGGQKQRVAIARALVNNPQIILADEPVGNLDSESAVNVLQILRELNEVDKKTVIMVTHNPEHLFYGDRIIKMKDGKIIGESVNKEKRPIEVIEKLKEEKEDKGEEIDIPNDLKLLMRTFKNLSPSQMGVLLVPFKAKQLLSHLVSELTEEQLGVAENLLREFIFRNIDTDNLRKSLDMTFEDGGANWNKLRAETFSKRVDEINAQVEKLKANPDSVSEFVEYLQKVFHLKFNDDAKLRFLSFIKLRADNRLDKLGLQKRLDTPKLLGGLGLYKATAEKIAREVELIMLLKYS